jgi:SAM-dependent methyltransferase
LTRSGYIAGNLAKNLAAPVLLPLARGRGSLGMDSDLGPVTRALARLAHGLGALGGSVAGAELLELGPGRTPELAMSMLLAGAASVTGVDTELSVRDGWHALPSYSELVVELQGDACSEFRRATATDAEGIRRRYAELDDEPVPLAFERFDGVHLSMPDSSLDLAYSKSVLEHVRPEDVEPLLTELRRVLRPRGVMVHLIDLRDHMRIEGDEVRGDWLDALRYSDRLFRAMFSKRSTYINRLRSTEWRRLFASAGFEAAMWTEHRYPFPETFSRDRLGARWRDLPPSELAVGQLDVALRVV